MPLLNERGAHLTETTVNNTVVEEGSEVSLKFIIVLHIQSVFSNVRDVVFFDYAVSFKNTPHFY